MEKISIGVATAALNQPGDEGWAYGRGSADWQRLTAALERKEPFRRLFCKTSASLMFESQSHEFQGSETVGFLRPRSGSSVRGVSWSGGLFRRPLDGGHCHPVGQLRRRLQLPAAGGGRADCLHGRSGHQWADQRRRRGQRGDFQRGVMRPGERAAVGVVRLRAVERSPERCPV